MKHHSHILCYIEFKPYRKLYYPYYLADAITNSLWVSLKPCNDARVCMKLPIRNIKGFKQHTYIYSYTQTHRQPDNQKKATLCCKCIGSSFFYSNEEQRFNYRIDQSHLAVFCIGCNYFKACYDYRPVMKSAELLGYPDHNDRLWRRIETKGFQKEPQKAL